MCRNHRGKPGGVIFATPVPHEEGPYQFREGTLRKLMMTRTLISQLGLALLCLSLASEGHAQVGSKPPVGAKAPIPGAAALPQGAKAPPAKPAPKNGQSIKITEAVRPAFIIDPIVNRIEARRGKVVDVEFGITGEGAASNLEIQPVALTQDENGTIFANTKVPAPKDLEILTPLTVQLPPNEKFVIKGRLRVPDTQSTFHTFGVLVRDAGQVKSQPNPEKADGPRIGIRFVTQYLLRCDVTVQGVRSENVAKLKIDSAELVEVDGIPVARVYVVNPTEGPIEFGLRTQIRQSEESESRPTFPLGMPVRANLEEPEKYIGRILPGARIRMVSPLNSPIFPGQYYMESSLLGDNHVVSKAGFPIVVTEGDYPAQGIATVQAAPGLLASPSQIELSLQRGGSRAEVLNFENTGSTPLNVEVIAEALDGTPVTWAGVRPNQVALAPGASRKVSVTLTASGDPNGHKYARLRVKSTPLGGTPTDTTPITVAALGRSTAQAILAAGNLIWDTEHGAAAFVVDVKNTGERHMPVEAKLILGDAEGHPTEIRGGFGVWVLPGSSGPIRFKPPKSLPTGKYTARLFIPTGAGQEPIDQRLEFDYTGVQ